MRYLILGSSAAGINGAKEIRRLDPKGEIIIATEDQYPYSRCILHHYIGGIRTLEELSFLEEDFFKVYNIDFKPGYRAEKLNREGKTVGFTNGKELSYDRLLIATGSNSFLPPIENLRETKNVVGFRHLEDCYEIMDRIEGVKNLVIIGCGLVGLDAMTGFLNRDMEISLVEMEDRLLPLQLDKRASRAYEELFEARGVNFYLKNKVTRVVQDEAGAIKALILDQGQELRCDLLIVAAGVRSNVDFLRGTGLELSDTGLKIDRRGRTNDPDIYGAGDVTGWGPIWPVAAKEGIIAGSNMAGVDRVMTDFFASKATMNYLGLPTMSLGDVNLRPEDGYNVEIEDEARNYRKIIHKDGKIYGAIIQGDLSYGGVLTQLIKEEIDISRVKKPIFKIDYSDFFHTTDSLEFSYE